MIVRCHNQMEIIIQLIVKNVHIINKDLLILQHFNQLILRFQVMILALLIELLQ